MAQDCLIRPSRSSWGRCRLQVRANHNSPHTPSRHTRYADDARTRLFYGELLTRVGALPGVQAVEATSHLPLVGGPGGFAFEVEGRPYVHGTGAPTTAERIVSPGYLQTMGISLLRGRALAHTDREQSLNVAVIERNDGARALARDRSRFANWLKRVWPRSDDHCGGPGWQRGVQTASRARSSRKSIGLSCRRQPATCRWSDASAADPMMLAGSLREAVALLDQTVPVSEIRTLNQLLASQLLTHTHHAASYRLCYCGTHAGGPCRDPGVLSYAVSRRAREIGVRMALGARRVDVLRMVLGHAALLAGAGIVGGVAAALATARVLEGLLFGVTRTDTATFVIVPILLAGVALLAACGPAHRGNWRRSGDCAAPGVAAWGFRRSSARPDSHSSICCGQLPASHVCILQ